MKRLKSAKLYSFTLFEVLLTMTISGIIISIVSMLFLNFNKIYHLQKSLANKNSEIIELFSAIKNDTRMAVRFEELLFGFKVIKPVNEVIYEIYDNSVTRKEGYNSRTFNFRIEDYRVEYLDRNKNLLKSVFFNIYLTNDLVYPIMFYTEESRKVLFEKEIADNY